ncbi:MAG: DEAD/DEAH box helicase [Pseudolysinimonas sp.]
MRAEPDFFLARRQLRRARIEDALALPLDVNTRLYRDRLLERLAVAADQGTEDFDELAEDVIDTVVSIALSELREDPTETIVVVATCIEVLARDGQFARIWVLASRVRQLAEELGNGLVAEVLRSVADLMLGQPTRAVERLQGEIGRRTRNGSAIPTDADATIEEFILAVGIGRGLARWNPAELDIPIRHFVATGDGLAFVVASAMSALIGAMRKSQPAIVVPSLDQTFRTDGLTAYLSDLDTFVLYPAQMRAIENGATQPADSLVSLPTSSGKTLLAELRIVATLARHPGQRAIYVAPYRLLARQVVRSFRGHFRPLGLTVEEFEGGYDTTGSADLPDVMVCTPERLDAIMRVASDVSDESDWARTLLGGIQLLVFDEVQLLGRAGRGPMFELILARLLQSYPDWEILALAAATSDVEALADWLTGRPTITGGRRPTGTLEIVWLTDGRLAQRVGSRSTLVGQLGRTKNAADDAASLMLRLGPEHLPALAIEPVRSYSESLARRLSANQAGDAWATNQPQSTLDLLQQVVEDVRSALGDDHPLTEYLPRGVAYHHAGLPTIVLEGIENLARSRALRFVCATTTVAEGADLPFRVVVLPHLNFNRGPLDRGLYGNIVGRAGRANVSMEGMVFVLESDAPTLAAYPRRVLWSDKANLVASELGRIVLGNGSAEQRAEVGEVQSQVLAWLGEPRSYVDNQAIDLAQRTFAWRFGRDDQRRVAQLFDGTLTALNSLGLVQQGSPYQLTDAGKRARLTGLSGSSVHQFEPWVRAAEGSWLGDLIDTSAISAENARNLAELLFMAEEVSQNSLWLRLIPDGSKADQLGNITEVWESGHIKIDTGILAAWIQGVSFVDIARDVPERGTAKSLFGKGTSQKRASDACEYLAKVRYPAAWVWSSLRHLAPNLGPQLPAFIRQCIDYGVSTETAAAISEEARVGRQTANLIGAVDSRWSVAKQRLLDIDPAELPIPSGDRSRLREWKRLQNRE